MTFNRTKTYSQSEAKMSALASLPRDLLLEISGFLLLRSDILHFSSSSSALYSNIVSALYSSVTLDTSYQCLQTLSMLHRRPEIARHVQHLLVRPNGGRRRTRSPSPHDGCAVASAVRRVARQLDALNTFVWDAEDGMPPYDDMWFALKILCPQLRTIGTSVGGYVPNHSHLFDFKNLIGFSLTFKASSHQDHWHDDNDTFPASSRLWDMLIDRSPNLEELSIDGFSAHSVDARRIVHGRWPHLRKLTLGDVIVDFHPANPNLNPTSPTEKPPSIKFLEAHTNLQSLRISRHALTPAHLSSLSASSLPRLTEFSGTLEQLQSLTASSAPSSASSHDISTSLQSVGFHEPMLVRDVTPLAVSVALRDLENLRELRLSFVLHSMYESGSLLRSLVGCCPRLEKIELACGHKPSFPLESFSKGIQHLHRLRSLSLTLVKFPGDDCLSTNAALLARTNPRLHQFTITFISSDANISLPLPHPLISHPSTFLESGTYTLTADEHGLPVSLSAVERIGQASSWGWGLHLAFRLCMRIRGLCVYFGDGGGGGAADVKRYKVDLRPRRRGLGGEGGVMGWVGLVVEGSKAGEEMRKLVFLVVLLWLAVWGFLVVGLERWEG